MDSSAQKAPAEADQLAQAIAELQAKGEIDALADLALQLVRAGVSVQSDAVRPLDPRTIQTQALADRVCRVHAQGVAIPDLCDRFGLSRPSVYRLLAIGRCLMNSQDESRQR
jgi:hypothetical protein